MEKIILSQVLAARDARAAAQKRLLTAYGLPLLCLTLNIAGPVKRSPLADFLFRETLYGLRLRLGGALRWEESVSAPTGLEAVMVCALPAEELKALAMEQETAAPAGRLLDLDVIAPGGEKLSRAVPRTCLVCGGPAGPCARSRAHGLPAIQAATRALLEDFSADRLSRLAVEALAAEAELTPKPGLVDACNGGSHTDMDLPLLLRSAQTLAPYFRRAAALGLERADCMPALQEAGLTAEEEMLSATGGVNTHRGAIYAFGLLLAAMGSALARGGDVFAAAAALAAAGAPPDPDSHGSAVGRQFQVAGARGEAMAGFPSVRRALTALGEGGPYKALLILLAETDDTNLLHRGGLEGLRFVQAEARRILACPPEAYRAQLEELDKLCIKKNLSPGGSADLLAAALFLARIEAADPSILKTEI